MTGSALRRSYRNRPYFVDAATGTVALGQVAIGIPCVIGGSAAQGLPSFREQQQ